MPLVTLSALKSFMGIKPADTTQDDVLQIFLDSVESSVIAYCETDFSAKVIAGFPGELKDGTDSDVIVPNHYPILSIQGVWLGCKMDGTGGYQLSETTDYYHDEASIYLRAYTPNQRGAVRLNYTWGYNSVPPEVKLCILQCVKAEYQRHVNKTEGLNSRSKEGESESFGGSAWNPSTGLPTSIQAKLEKYKVVEFPNPNMAQRNR